MNLFFYRRTAFPVTSTVVESAFPETNISIIVDGIFAVGDAVDLSSIVFAPWTFRLSLAVNVVVNHLSCSPKLPITPLFSFCQLDLCVK